MTPLHRKSLTLPILLTFLSFTVGWTLWMRFIRQLFPGLPASITATYYQGVPPETNPWLEPWQRWDTLHYQAIAERGYAAFDTAYFTPPLFPYLMRWLTPLFDGNSLAAGLFVSTAAFLGCLFAIHRLSLLESDDASTAMRTVIYLASFPTAFFLMAAYSESLFLLSAILCLYFSRKRRWLAAGLAGGFAALARIPGLVLAAPLAYAAWEAWRQGDRRGWLAPLGMGALTATWYAWLWFGLGQPPTVVLEALQQRGGHLTLPGLNLLAALQRIVSAELILENSLELGFALLFILLTVFIWKMLPRLYGLYAATLMLFFLSRMGSPQPLVSMARYCLEIFPAFLLLARWGSRPRIHRLILYLSWIGLLFLSAQFAIWGWVG
ncbi:MAG: mannosyltransferase family protein [Anaerolineales bacterium]